MTIRSDGPAVSADPREIQHSIHHGTPNAAMCHGASSLRRHMRKDTSHMDKFKDKASEMMGGGIGNQLKDINFPCSKDELLSQLQQKGVPDQVLDRVRNVDTKQFDSADEVKTKIGL
jgi:hypothetical protein